MLKFTSDVDESLRDAFHGAESFPRGPEPMFAFGQMDVRDAVWIIAHDSTVEPGRAMIACVIHASADTPLSEAGEDEQWHKRMPKNWLDVETLAWAERHLSEDCSIAELESLGFTKIA